MREVTINKHTHSFAFAHGENDNKVYTDVMVPLTEHEMLHAHNRVNRGKILRCRTSNVKDKKKN